MLPANSQDLRSQLHNPSNLSPALSLSFKISALTLAAKLDVTQVIRDPRVPVHFGNKVRGEGKDRKEVKEMETQGRERGSREAAA